MLTIVLATSDVQKLPQDSLGTLVTSKTLWKFAYHEDPSVRRALYRLLDSLLSLGEGYIDWKVISTCLLSKALANSQRASATEFSALLLNVTQTHPQIWTTDYSGKTSATKRLLQYIKKGSEGASHTYWENLFLLVKAVPREVVISQDQERESATSLLAAFHEGILSREEPRVNIFSAWSAYLNTVIWAADLFPNKDEKIGILQDHLGPVVLQYVLGDPEKSQWTINDPQASKICAGSVLASFSSNWGPEFFQQLWSNVTEALILAQRLSLPEQSSGYRQSQDSICAMASRFFGLVSMLMDKAKVLGEMANISSLILEITNSLLQASADLLGARNGKPYSAAEVLNEAALIPGMLNGLDNLEGLLSNGVPNLIFSPSADRMVSFLFRCRNQTGFESGLDKSVTALYDANQETIPTIGLRGLFSSVTSEIVESNERVQSLVTRRLYRALGGSRDAWTDIILLLKNPNSTELAPRIIRRIFDGMCLDDTTLEALYGLGQVTRECEGPVRTFAAGPDGPKLISRLLYLSESPDDAISSLADSLHSTVNGLIKHEDSSSSTVEIVQHNFKQVGLDSLS